MILFEERFNIVKSCKYVDEVVIQDGLYKIKAWKKYNYNALFSDGGWKNNPRCIDYEKCLTKKGVDVVYFPYTQGVSSSLLREKLGYTNE